MGRGDCFLCCLTWGQTMVEVMKIMVTSLKGSVHALLHSLPPTLQQAPMKSHLYRRLLNTLRQVWVCLLWGVTTPFSWEGNLGEGRGEDEAVIRPRDHLLWQQWYLLPKGLCSRIPRHFKTSLWIATHSFLVDSPPPKSSCKKNLSSVVSVPPK